MGIEIDIMEVMRTSATLMVLFFCSIVAVMVMLNRMWVFRQNKVDSKWLLKRVRRGILEARWQEIIAFLSKRKGSIALIFREGIQRRTLSKGDMEEYLANLISEENIRLEKYLNILGTLGSMTPFIGLLGTVIGIIRAFRDLAAASGGGPSVVASGIAEALVATAGGLIVAIPALMFFNYFISRVKVMNSEMEIAARNLVLLLYAQEER